jgi:hypothetical protein
MMALQAHADALLSKIVNVADGAGLSRDSGMYCRRINFYVDNGNGIHPEAGVGGNFVCTVNRQNDYRSR